MEIKFLFHILLLTPIIFAFDSTFKYGCNVNHCSFQLAIPKEAAEFIDETALSYQVQLISNSLLSLNLTIHNNIVDQKSIQNFTDTFNKQYEDVINSINDLGKSVKNVSQIATELQTSSAKSAQSAQDLSNAISCFKNSSLPNCNCMQLTTTSTTVTVTTNSNTNAGSSTTASSDTSGSPQTGTTAADTNQTGNTAADNTHDEENNQ